MINSLNKELLQSYRKRQQSKENGYKTGKSPQKNNLEAFIKIFHGKVNVTFHLLYCQWFKVY